MTRALRGVFAISLLALAPLWVARDPARPAARGRYLAYVGTYTTNTNSKGIYAYRFDAETGQLSSIGLVAETTDPSFLAVHPSGRYAYAVNEIGNHNGEKSGAVSAYAVDHTTGKLAFLNQVSSRGPGPCYVSLDKTGSYVLVANYDGGGVATFPVLPDGKLGDAAAFVQHSGSSVDKERQEAAHPHWIEASPDNRFAVVADLGLDEVFIYRFDPAKGSLTANHPAFVKVNPGAGPRHFAFHSNGKFAYVLNELQSTVTAFSYDSERGVLRLLQTVSALPKDFSGANDAAELVVHASGKFLYASNRGHDTIAIFAIDSVKGTLTPIADVPTKGKTPRNFAIDPTGTYRLAANQESNDIVVFRIDAKTGGLTPAGQVVEVPSPVSIVFVASE